MKPSAPAPPRSITPSPPYDFRMKQKVWGYDATSQKYVYSAELKKECHEKGGTHRLSLTWTRRVKRSQCISTDGIENGTFVSTTTRQMCVCARLRSLVTSRRLSRLVLVDWWCEMACFQFTIGTYVMARWGMSGACQYLARIESVDDTEGVYNLLYADGFQGAVSKHGGVRRLNKKEMDKYKVRSVGCSGRLRDAFRMKSPTMTPSGRSWFSTRRRLF